MGISESERLVTLVKELAGKFGFELVGVTPALPIEEAGWYGEWAKRGYAAGMGYLKDHRAELRADPRSLLPSAKSIVCLGKLYNPSGPYSTEYAEPGRAWISRYAWGRDYHPVIRKALKGLVRRLKESIPAPFEWKICVDTAPLMERAYARRAGLGWIGKNSCLINQGQGSWFFLAEVLLSLDLKPDAPPPDCCGTCRRCIEACPTAAIVPTGSADGPAFTLDSNRCISYLTIEHRGPISEALHQGMGRNVFGCDICQDVCPWNSKAPVTNHPDFGATHAAPAIETLTELGEEAFRQLFRGSAVMRARYEGFRRNVAIAKSNQTSE